MQHAVEHTERHAAAQRALRERMRVMGMVHQPGGGATGGIRVGTGEGPTAFCASPTARGTRLLIDDLPVVEAQGGWWRKGAQWGGGSLETLTSLGSGGRYPEIGDGGDLVLMWLSVVARFQQSQRLIIENACKCWQHSQTRVCKSQYKQTATGDIESCLIGLGCML